MSILLRFSVPSPQPKLLVTAIIQLLVATLAVVAAAPVALPGCPEACGSITVPYPFGIRQGCSRPGFNLTCDETSHPPNLFLGDGVRVDAISLADGTVRVLSKIVNNLTPLNGSTSIRWSGGLMPNATISVSSEHNDFVVVGCNVIARLVANYSDVNQHFSVSACATLCDRFPEPALPEPEDTPPPCSGVGCCHTTIASDMPAYEVQFKDFPQTSDPSSWSDDGAFRQDAPFGAAIVDRSWFSENVSAMLNDPFGRGHRGRVTVVPTVLYWWLDPERDADVVFLDPNVSLWRCIGLNSVVDSVVDLGVGGKQLRCSCLEGYEGNPYVVQGCQDIDECQQRDVYSCLHGTCINMPGTYRCLAKKSIISLPGLITAIAISAGLGLLFSVLGAAKITKKLKQQRAKKLRQKFFKKNHGLLLQQLISSNKDIAERTRIFSWEELEQATNKFDNNRILGGGAMARCIKASYLINVLWPSRKPKLLSRGKSTSS